MRTLLIALSAAACGFLSLADNVVYVAPTGSDSNDGSQGHPFLTINKAVSTLNALPDIATEGGTVYLADGTYTDDVADLSVDDAVVSNTAVVVTNPISIEGSSKDPSRVTVQRTSSDKFRLFYLNNENAALRHLTISSGELRADWLHGGGVFIDSNGGTVENCIVTDCKNGGNGQQGAAGIFMKAGRVTHTIVRNCTAKNARNYGTGIYAEGGLIDNCLVTGCVSFPHPKGNGNGAVCLMGTAKMVNSTVAKNKSCFVSGLIVGSATAQAVNCAVYGNELCTDSHDPDWTTRFTGCCATLDVGRTDRAPLEAESLTSAFVNCASENFLAGSAGCIKLTSSPFVDIDGNDFSFTGNSSPLANTGDGALAAEIDDSLLDLAGNARSSGLRVDIGAYELQEVYSLRGTSDVTTVMLSSGGSVTFTAETSGATGAESFSWDFGDGSAMEVTSELTVTHVYTAGGNYTVTVSASDGNRNVSYTLLDKINVLELGFSAAADETAFLVGANARFYVHDVTTDDTVTYVWNFGDGETETTTEEEVFHAYASPGAYTVSVVGTLANSGSYESEVEGQVRVVPRDLYVKPSNQGEGEPYSSWALAGTRIATVLEYAVDGCVIHLAPGTYNNDKASNVMVDKAVTIVGEGATPDVVIIPGHATNTGKRNMSVVNEGAFVCNLTLYGGFTGQSSDPNLNAGGGNLYLTAGVVSNCVLSSGRTRQSGPDGGGARVTGGLLTHCVITNSFSANRGNGLVLTQSGGRVSNCLITCNKKEWESSRNPISLVYVSGGVMDNCTIAKCWIMYNTNEGKFQTTDKAFNVTGTGKAYNCAIADINYVGYSSAVDQVVDYTEKTPQRWAGTAANFVNCVTDDATAINETCRASTTDRMFVDYAAGNLQPGTGLKSWGAAIDGCAFPSVDLAGNKRVAGRAIDVGCYEGVDHALKIVIR